MNMLESALYYLPFVFLLCKIINLIHFILQRMSMLFLIECRQSEHLLETSAEDELDTDILVRAWNCVGSLPFT